MRRSIPLVPGQLIGPSLIEKRKISVYPIQAGQRDVCELYNDGVHVYARMYSDGRSTPYFVWLPYRTSRPLVRHAGCGIRCIANLKNPETVRLHLDGHLGTTALVMFHFFRWPNVSAEQYLVIGKQETVKVDLRASLKREKIAFTKFQVI